MHKHERERPHTATAHPVVGRRSFSLEELVTEDDTPSSHGSTDTKSHHLPPTPPNQPTLEGIPRTSPDKTQENMLSIDLFIIHILNTHPKEKNETKWNGRSL